MMLEHLQESEIANKVRRAISKLENQQVRTQDLGGQATCSEMTAAIINNL